MRRRICKVDANQRRLTDGLRAIGASVQPIHDVGSGCPDLLVGWRGVNYLFEVKDGAKVPSKRRLTGDEEDWHDEWRGSVHTVKCLDEALKLLGIRRG